MSKNVREMTREELVWYNNELRAENDKLKLENEKLKKELQEARLTVENNHNIVKQEELRCELCHKDGEIQGLCFAMRCIINGFRKKSSLDV